MNARSRGEGLCLLGLVTRSVLGSPLGRIGTPEDVARVVVFLLGPLSGWITGQTILADGGASLSI